MNASTTAATTTTTGWIEDTMVQINPIVKIGMVASVGIISVYTRRRDDSLEIHYQGKSDREAAAVVADLAPNLGF